MGAMKETETAEILLVEDNPNDAELTLNALREHHISKAICVASDGTEALDFVFGTGKYTGRGDDRLPRLVILDLKLPKVDPHVLLCLDVADPKLHHLRALDLMA